MNLTLLVDLDDTLLKNDIDQFLPNYLGALSKHLASRFPGEQMVRELMRATQAMIANRDPGVTLEEAFDRVFYPALGVTKEGMQEAITSFYRDVFPTLQSLTSPRPEAQRMVQEALDKGFQVVVATNPLFPLTAIEQRLAWAGLPVDKVPFTLVSSYESFHFTKPCPAYYGEILAQIGWPNQPAVMVGNNLQDDILPAAALGLPTFWLGGGSKDGDTNPLSRRGELSGVMAWAEEIAGQEVPIPAMTPGGMMNALLSTPAALDTITRKMDSSFWKYRPDEAEWSVTEILCHLRDADLELNKPRIQRICQEENVFIPGINTDLWAEERQYQKQDGELAMRQFIEARKGLLEVLGQLPVDYWQRIARHAIFGPTTLTELVGFTANHDRTHIQQVLCNLHGG